MDDHSTRIRALTSAWLAEPAQKTNDDEQDPPDITSTKKVGAKALLESYPTWRFYPQDSPECRHFLDRFGMTPLGPAKEPGEPIGLLSFRILGRSQSPELERFATETLAFYKDVERSKFEMFPFALRIYRFDSRCDEKMMMAVDVRRPARPYIERLRRDGHGWWAPTLILVNTPPEQYEEVTLGFAPGMRLVAKEVVKQHISIAKRGGKRNPKELQELWSDQNCKRFAQLVGELSPKWQWIKSNSSRQGFAPAEWVAAVRTRPEFKGLFGSYKKLTDDLLLRIADSKLSKTDRQPVALACVHAARELGYSDIYQRLGRREPPASTLRTYYGKGLILLKNHPSEQN